jgi:protein-tyrosine phosphatase
MRTEIHWIQALKQVRLALMPRPRGWDWLSDEILGWCQEGVGLVVSLLQAPEVRELGLEAEARLCEHNGIEFVSFPIPDRGVPPSLPNTRRLVDDLHTKLRSGVGVAIHCRAGIGRSALIAGCVLLRLGVEVADVFPMLARARRLAVPDTRAQEEWLTQFSTKAVGTF